MQEVGIDEPVISFGLCGLVVFCVCLGGFCLFFRFLFFCLFHFAFGEFGFVLTNHVLPV